VTFKDEVSLLNINASLILTSSYYYNNPSSLDGSVAKSFFYSNPGEYENYSFCFTPEYQNITLGSPVFDYYAAGYPQRSFSQSSMDLNNGTGVVTLWLLGSADGVPTTFQVSEHTGAY